MFLAAVWFEMCTTPLQSLRRWHVPTQFHSKWFVLYWFLLCCDREATSCGGTKCSCTIYLVNINVNLYTLRLLILPETCVKVGNSVFATHCTGDILNLVHTGGHAVAVSELHKVTPSTIFWPLVKILQISQEMYAQFSVVVVCKPDIDASNGAYQLLQLCNDKVNFNGVTPFYLSIHCYYTQTKAGIGISPVDVRVSHIPLSHAHQNRVEPGLTRSHGPLNPG